MKTRIMMATVLALATFGAGACKKKKEGDQPAAKTNEPATTGSATGSNNMAQGSAMAPETPAKPEKPAKKEGKDLAQHYLDCGKQIEAKAWDEFKKNCVADGFVAHMEGMPDDNWDAMVAHMKEMSTAVPDMKMEPQVVIVNGRNVFAVQLMSGTQSGPMKMPGMDMPATNKKFGMLFFQKLTFDDENKGTEDWGYMDPMTFMGQLGLMPKETPPVRPVMEKGMDGAPMIIVAADDEKEKKNLEAAKAATKAFESHKVPDIMATYTDDALESDQADAKDLKGKKEIQASLTMFLKAFPDIKMSGDPQYYAAGDYVVLMGKFEGTNKGALGKMKATNKPVQGEVVEIMEMKDGKVAKLWRFRNGMTMAMQLGLLPAPGGGEAPKGDAPPKKDDKAPAKKDDAKKSG